MSFRHAAKRDRNEPDIIAALRGVGAVVCQNNGEGYPDLTVLFRGTLYLLEVKVRGKKLTPKQQVWHAEFQADTIGVVYGIGDALRFIGAIDDQTLDTSA